MYLNLTEGFDPYNTNFHERVRHSISTFPGGEPNVHIDIAQSLYVDVSIRITSFNDMGILMMAMDALRRTGAIVMSIYIPYMPGARQDRIMKTGEALSVKVYADILNSFDTEIIIADPHSDVAVALLDNVRVINNHAFVHDAIVDIFASNPFDTAKIISPDAGSNKKALKVLQSLSPSYDLIKCDKTRDVITGNITDFEVYSDNLQGKICLVIDDICSNGGTFLGLADELKKKNAGDLYLIVTHGEFGHMRGETMGKLASKFKHIYYSDSFREVHADSKVSTQIPIKV